MGSNIQKLKRIKPIIEVTLVTVDEEMENLLGVKYAEIAKNNAKHVFAYRFTYRSGKNEVVGYIVEPRKGNHLPCVIHNRGGSGDYGKIERWKLFFDFAELAREGYLVITTQYSGNEGGTGKDEMGGREIHDILKLFEILKQYPRTDITRIGMFGESRGGMMTYLCLKQVKWVKAAVVLSGLTDLPNDKTFRPEMIKHYKKMFGGSLTEMRKRSVVHWADHIPKHVPILMMNGSADWRVDPSSALKLSGLFLKHRVPHRFVLFEGADHSLSEFRNEKKALILEWFARYLKKTRDLPNLQPHGK